ncbi:hypothetical protein LCGC14_2568880, partial [marine sediment metagenome]
MVPSQLVAWATLLLLAAPGVADEDVETLFRSLYGKQVKEVTRTGRTEDDVALAGAMVDGVRTTEMPEALIKRICTQAYQLTYRLEKGDGWAIDAMELLARKVP